MLYEPVLRLMSGEPARRVSVPILFDGGQVLRGSLEIGRHADAIGTGSKLFASEREVLAVDDLTERFMHLGRVRVLLRLREDAPALVESLPPPMRRMPALFLPVARSATDFLIDKYRCREVPPAESEATMTGLLDQLEALRGGREHVVGEAFSFADIAVAGAVGFVMPHAAARLGTENRRIFTEPRIAAAYPDLVAWRDRTIMKYR